MKTFRIAVIGCTHGQLDLIYERCRIKEQDGIPVDLVLCCGDFEANRAEYDLKCMVSPKHFMHLKDFHKYYSGESAAPILTVFCGGNHEAMAHMWELFYGGWAAPNIYFLGYSGIVNYGGYRIGGISGIFNSKDYRGGHYERPPFAGNNQLRSTFHTREYEEWKLSLLKPDQIDIMMSHDWPLGVLRHGDLEKTMKDNPTWRDQLDKETLGSPASWHLLNTLRPKYWFSGHMHYRFEASIPHKENNTKFLALSKPHQFHTDFIEFIDLEHRTDERVLRHDLEWLSVLNATHRPQAFTPAQKNTFRISEADINEAQESIEKRLKPGSLDIKHESFVRTGSEEPVIDFSYNPQTFAIQELAGIPTFFLSSKKK